MYRSGYNVLMVEEVQGTVAASCYERNRKEDARVPGCFCIMFFICMFGVVILNVFFFFSHYGALKMFGE